MVRSADVAEDRQGGGGGGFSAPAFSIPFQVGVVVIRTELAFELCKEYSFSQTLTSMSFLLPLAAMDPSPSSSLALETR